MTKTRRYCKSYIGHTGHPYETRGEEYHCPGRVLMGDLLPEVLTDCLDCEILAPEKCVFHGKHGGHRLQLLAFKEEDSGLWSNRYYCNDCRKWAWE